jgi:glycosyltransferase involved in cell wall biosynthesis
VAVISLMPLDYTLGDEMFADLPTRGIETDSLGMARGVPDPRAVLRLRRTLRSFRPDVLHAHMVHAILVARATRMVQRVPVLISTMHNQHQGSRWRYRAYRLTDRFSDLTTTVSRLALEDTVRLGAAPADRIMVMPNGTDVAGFRRDDAARADLRSRLGLGTDFTWLAVGRLDEAKDYPNMLAAAAALADGPPFRLLIAGAGPLESTIAEGIADRGLGDRVELLGLRSDMPALMAAADGFVMSSAWEGLPMVLLEAGASGLPTVATDVGGSHDAIIDGVSGHIVPTADPAALAAAMRRVMDLPQDEREAMGAAGREHVVGTFDMEAVADRWVGLYDELSRSAGGT